MRRLRSLLWIVAAGCALAQDYGGPAILSRGQAPTNTQGPAASVLRPFISVSGVYDTGLAAFSLNSKGQVPDVVGPGVEAGFGVDGLHSWRHTTLGLDYHGDYRHYTGASLYDGGDNTVSLSVMHQSSRRLQYELDADAGTFTRAFGLGGTGYSPFLTNLANNNIFDNRVNYLQTGGRVTYLKTARLSFSGSGSGYLVRRASSALYGVTGSYASGDMVYRYSRFGTIGIDYRFDHFDFTKAFGSTNMHTVSVEWALRLSRRWELSAEVGGSQVEYQNLRQVALDPVIAAILGTQTGVAAAWGKNYVPAFGARLTRAFRQASLQFGYKEGVMPGNGVYTTVRQQVANAGLSYTGIRKWNFGLNLGRDSMGSMGMQNVGNYSGEMAGAGFTRSIGRHDLHVICNFQARRFDITMAHFNRVQYTATLGFAYSPGELPLRFW